MTRISFYYDPSCPWCWITSRWLTEVQTARALEIDWLPFSLALKNGELDGEDVTGHLRTHTIAHKVLRLVEAVHSEEGIDRGELFTQFGKSYFIDPKLDDDNFVRAVLERMDLSTRYVDELENTDHDQTLRRHLDNAVEIAGDDVGVPLIIFETEDERPLAYFGPVIARMPTPERGLELWDSIACIATGADFFELKRNRTSRSKVKTTKRLFPELS